jgi:hypothetical protein
LLLNIFPFFAISFLWEFCFWEAVTPTLFISFSFSHSLWLAQCRAFAFFFCLIDCWTPKRGDVFERFVQGSSREVSLSQFLTTYPVSSILSPNMNLSL